MTKKQPIITVFKADQKTSREKYEDLLLKSDRLRKKYDLRYTDSDRVNNIFVRGYINKLKIETEERKKKNDKR